MTFEEYDAPGFKTMNSIVTAGGAKAAWFKDSEGNILAVVQNLIRSGAASSFRRPPRKPVPFGPTCKIHAFCPTCGTPVYLTFVAMPN